MDLSGIAGSGPGGRITASDVEAAKSGNGAAPAPAPSGRARPCRFAPPLLGSAASAAGAAMQARRSPSAASGPVLGAG